MLLIKDRHLEKNRIEIKFHRGIPLKDDRRISILEKLFLYRL